MCMELVEDSETKPTLTNVIVELIRCIDACTYNHPRCSKYIISLCLRSAIRTSACTSYNIDVLILCRSLIVTELYHS